MKVNKIIFSIYTVIFLFITSFEAQGAGKTYYVDSKKGNDQNDGLSSQTSWQTLQKANQAKLTAGDRLLLKCGSLFKGALVFDNTRGSKDAPVIISSYKTGSGDTDLPVIQAEGYTAAVQIKNGSYIHVSELELTSDSGAVKEKDALTQRYGVRILADLPGIYQGIRLSSLKIHHIFACKPVKDEGLNPTSNKGMGIAINMLHKEALIKNVTIEDCDIEMTGHTGIRVFGWREQNVRSYLDSLFILNNRLTHIGGPGMVVGVTSNVLVRGNTVCYSGSSADSRMHQRGSCFWPWTSKHVLIEKNKFMHARGKMDSAGAHIDFNCSDVIVQYNLSMDNAGGFVEILGNDRNCAYRYNISINDGFRVKGENNAESEGKVIWTGGFVGNGVPQTGPFNSYIYNNTVYVKEGSRSCFCFSSTTDGVLIANNIFYIHGKTLFVNNWYELDKQFSKDDLRNIFFINNLYASSNVLPEFLRQFDQNPVYGGLRDVELIKNKSIEIKKLPGDDVGLLTGFKVDRDYLGQPITGIPDLGAIEY